MDQPIQQKFTTWTPRRVVLSTLIVVSVSMAFWMLLRYKLVLFSLFEAVVFSTAITPLVSFFERRHISRPVAIGITFLIIVLLLAGFVVIAVPLIIEQGATLSSTITTYYAQLRNILLHSSNIFVQRLAFRLPATLLNFTPPATATNPVDNLALGLGYLAQAWNAIFATVAVLLLTIYWTLEREKTIQSLLLFFAKDRRANIEAIITTTEARVGAYIRGLAILSASIGSLALIAYLIIGLPHVFLLGLMAAVFEVVPIIGPVLGALPAGLVALSTDPSKLIWVIIAVVVIQFSENHLLVPRVMNKQVGVNPVLSLLSFAAFGSLFGLAGALLAVPMAVLFQILVERFFLGPIEQSGLSVDGRGEISLLRY